MVACRPCMLMDFKVNRSQAYLPGFHRLQYEKRDKSLGDKPGNEASPS